MTNPINPYTNPNPKKDPTRKAAAKAKKAQRKAPTKGTALNLDDTELPKLPNGSVDYTTLHARLSKSDGTAANRKAALRMFDNWALVNNRKQEEIDKNDEHENRSRVDHTHKVGDKVHLRQEGK